MRRAPWPASNRARPLASAGRAECAFGVGLTGGTTHAACSAAERKVEVRPGRVIVERRSTGEPGDARVEVVRIVRGTHHGGPLPPLQADAPEVALPPLTLHGQPLNVPLSQRGKGVTEKLGMRDVEGLRAEGTRNTWTIPAGAIGNDRPIVSVSEQWYSPDLQTTLLATSSDPRSGETTYRLTNIRRAEPPPELFRVPSDYRER